jgi:malonyl-CoA/methylmalonyl-CoA synthetase
MRTLLDAALAHPPDSPALRAPGGRPFSYGSLSRASAGLAAELVGQHGVRPGDRVAILVEPGARFVVSLFAVWRARAVALVLSPLHPPKERRALLEDAAAMLVVTSEVHEDAARASAAGIPVVTLAWGAERASDEDAERGWSLAPRPQDRALLMYTSGTTGKPKGVILRHEHLEAQLGALGRAWGMRRDDVLVHALPLHHIHGLSIAMLNVLRAGGLVELHPTFDARAVLDACASATVFMGVPTMYARLVDALAAMPDDEREAMCARLRAMRLCVSGSAALPVSLGDRWASYAGRYPLERFGMTELGVALTNPLEGERAPGLVGTALEGVRTRVIDDAGAEAHEGELLIGGPTVFEGYHERPEANAASFVSVGGERFFKTGDSVSIDAQGRVRILGRTSVDILKSAGYKLSAIEIEEAIRRHPRVRDAAVVGLPDETYGQRVAAAVMPKDGEPIAVDELVRFLASELAPYKVPRAWRVVEDVPRNALGKVLKPELARLFAEAYA